MKPGTPGFVGSRLREARELRALSAQQLGEMLGVTRSAISQYERDQSSPHPIVMRQIALILNLPTGFFLLPHRPESQVQVFFRSKVATTKTARARGGHRLRWLGEIVTALARRLHLPNTELQLFEPVTDPRRLGDEDIDDMAVMARQSWGLGEAPIANVVWLLESKGAIVTRGEIFDALMDSFSRWDTEDEHPLIFLNADKSSAVRSRFDAAHELGHLLIHRYVPEEYWGRDLHLREQQANKFASAFLLPANAFSRDVPYPSLDTFQALKPKWMVAISAMLMRCQSLGLVTDAHAERLWQNLGRRHWRTREPLDDELVVEVPRFLRTAFETLATHDPAAPSALLAELQLPAQDVVSLAMLPHSFFEPTTDLSRFSPT